VADALEERFNRGYISRGRPLSERKLSDYRGVARVHITPRLGGRRLGDVTLPLLRAHFDGLDRAHVGIPRQRAVNVLLSSLLNEHVKLGTIQCFGWS
jgi:hypothetical protein